MIATPPIRPTLRRGMKCVAIPALMVLAASAATAQTVSGGTGIDGPTAAPVPTPQVGGSGSREGARNNAYPHGAEHLRRQRQRFRPDTLER